MGKPLIHLAVEKAELANRLMDLDGELDQITELELSENDEAIASKIDDYYWRLFYLDMTVEQGKQLKKVIDQKMKSATKSIKFLKERLVGFSELIGDKKLKGNQWRFSVSDTQGKLEIVNEDIIPATYLKERVVYEIDKDAIKKAILSGEDVPGCRIVPGKSVRSYMNEAMLCGE